MGSGAAGPSLPPNMQPTNTADQTIASSPSTTTVFTASVFVKLPTGMPIAVPSPANSHITIRPARHAPRSWPATQAITRTMPPRPVVKTASVTAGLRWTGPRAPQACIAAITPSP